MVLPIDRGAALIVSPQDRTMLFSDWLFSLRSSSPRLRVRRSLRDGVIASQVMILEPRALLSGQPVDDAAYLAHLQATGAVVDVLPPINPDDVTAQGAEGPAQGPFPDADTFKLHSRPSATKVIYLDFDGHTNVGTPWNDAQRPSIVSPAFDFEGGAATFTTNELGRIQQIWQRVEEAFSPFDVDVTTEEPPPDDLRNTGGGDTRWGMRVIIGGDSNATLGISAGGVAYIGSFDGGADIGCYVFPLNLGPNGEKFIADATAHEVGHTLGLLHDGRNINPPEGYYQGHGSGATGWAPIMGVGYSKQLVQWSKGEYPNADNTAQDDLAIIVSQNGFGYRTDLAGGSAATAAALNVDANGMVDQSGVIEQTNDQDWYRFNTAGSVNFSINPAVRGAMLDILAEIYDSNGQLVASSNPVDQLTASFNTVLPVGTYFLKIDGIGKAANGNDFGYSDYASIGQFFITGNIQLQPNQPPVVNNQTMTVAENSPAGTVVGTVAATDANPGQILTYAITGGNTGNTFAINAATGQITVADPTLLNFESPTAFNLTVQVTDDGTPVLSDTATVTISVTDVNEPPVVAGVTNYFLVEQPPVNTVIGALGIFEPDNGQTHTWSITAGNTGNAFAINPTTGLITVANPSAILFATTPTFSLTVQALDNGTPALAGTATVTINVLDRNLPPTINDQQFTIAENSTGVVGTVVASDPDPFQTVTYSITGGNPNNAFDINGVTGQLFVNNPAAIDFEANPTITLTVTVNDNAIPKGSNSATITVHLTDANDAPKVNPATFTVIEFTPNGSLVGQVTATDQDVGQSVSYAITGGNTGNAFAIDSATGKITIANTNLIDFSNVPVYSLTVQATDNGNPAASGTGVVTINVSDLNRPPFLPDQNFRVFEFSPVGSVVGTVYVSDPDVGQPQIFSILSGNTGNAFAIDSATGKLTVKTPSAIDFETLPVFNLVVEVRDNTLFPQIKTATMKIEVLDVVEQPLINPQSFVVAENRPAGYVIGTVAAQHPDPSRTLTYAITGGNYDGLFAINASTGQLTITKATLNYEISPELTLTVTVTDDSSPAESRSAPITIKVLDLNEAPTLPAMTFNISENRPVGYVIGAVKAYDQDEGQTLKYAITAGNADSIFALNPDSGQLTVAKGILNFETQSQYQLTVSATDNGVPVQSRSSTVTINILDLNEPPVFTPKMFAIAENRPAGTVVGSLGVIDPDLNQTLTYSILGGDPDGIFAVNAQGQLIVARPILNYEAKSQFDLQIGVSDNGTPQQSRSAAVTVLIRDLNEAPVLNPQTFLVPEKLPLGASVGKVVAFDQDIGQTLSFAITGGNAGGAFAIDAATGQVTVANPQALLFDVNPQFALTVAVSDNGTPVQSRTGTVTVKLQKVNAPPVVPALRLSVTENSPVATEVGTVAATDADAGQTLKYAITAGNLGSAFTINATTGKITIANPAAIDYEAIKSFQLTVTATDNGSPVQTGSGVVTIDVLNANDPPIVNNQTFQVAENVPVNTVVGTVQASDPEGLPNLKYEIVGGNPNQAFVIDPNTGVVRVSSAFMFDYETNPTLSFLLKVSDSSTPAMSSTATMTFKLINQNDAPVIANQTMTVSRTASNGFVVGLVKATDQDAGQTLKYEIVGGNTGTAFGINVSTGALFVANRNALTGRSSIPVTVKVTDNSPQNLSATATVTVNITSGAASIGTKNESTSFKPIVAATPAGQTVTASSTTTASGKAKSTSSGEAAAVDFAPNGLLERAVTSKVSKS